MFDKGSFTGMFNLIAVVTAAWEIFRSQKKFKYKPAILIFFGDFRHIGYEYFIYVLIFSSLETPGGQLSVQYFVFFHQQFLRMLSQHLRWFGK